MPHQAEHTKLNWWLPGLAALLIIASLTGLPLAALLWSVHELPIARLLQSDYTQRVVIFSLWQAFLSTLLSLGLAIPTARALSREPRFPGRQWLVNLFSLSLVLPSILAIFGIVAVYGRSGWLNDVLLMTGMDRVSIYGLSGILLAHVFFNLPLATRVLLQSFDNIPGEHWRLAAQLSLPIRSQWRFIEWPAIRGQLPGLIMLIFTLCFTSFAIVMTLGGGPRATTIEVAIYQAIRFDFDFGAAVTLALVQLILCVLLMLISSLFRQNTDLNFSARTLLDDYRPAQSFRALNLLLIVLATLFTILPLAGLLLSAANPAVGKVLAHGNTQRAVFNTVLVALSSAGLSLLMAALLLSSTRHLRVRLNQAAAGQWLQLSGNVILVLPPLVLGTGLFLLLRPYADVFSLALVLVILINSLMALPFVLRILDGPVMQFAEQHDRLIQSLGVRGWHRLRWLDWPGLRRPVGLSLAVASTLAAGDLSAIALFGSERVITLPLLLYQRMGSYRMYDAAVTAAILLLVCLLLFLFLQRVVGGRASATPAS